MRIAHLALLPAAALVLTAASPPKPKTPSDIVAAAPKSDWSEIPASDLLVVDLKNGRRVVIQLAPDFAPVHVANIRALARGGWWTGSAIYRVQDNYVAQWGNNDGERKMPSGVALKPPAEYARRVAGLSITPVSLRDAYAPRTGIARGWPMAWDPKTGTANLTHCYGMVGVGRDLSPDTGTGGELYAVIGHAPRHLDRNIALVGRVVSGIDAMSALPRGTEALGFYKERSSDVPLASARLASDMAVQERPRFEVLMGRSLSAYIHARANRKDDFFIRPAGGVDICNVNVPVRPVSG